MPLWTCSALSRLWLYGEKPKIPDVNYSLQFALIKNHLEKDGTGPGKAISQFILSTHKFGILPEIMYHFRGSHQNLPAVKVHPVKGKKRPFSIAFNHSTGYFRRERPFL